MTQIVILWQESILLFYWTWEGLKIYTHTKPLLHPSPVNSVFCPRKRCFGILYAVTISKQKLLIQQWMMSFNVTVFKFLNMYFNHVSSCHNQYLIVLCQIAGHYIWNRGCRGVCVGCNFVDFTGTTDSRSACKKLVYQKMTAPLVTGVCIPRKHEKDAFIIHLLKQRHIANVCILFVFLNLRSCLAIGY